LRTGSETTPVARDDLGIHEDILGREWTYLDPSGGHIEFRGEFLAQLRVWLCVLFENGLKDLELLAGGPFPMLNLIGSIRVESAEVNGGWILCVRDKRTWIVVVMKAHRCSRQRRRRVQGEEDKERRLCQGVIKSEKNGRN